MQYKKIDDVFLMRLAKGEKVIESLLTFCQVEQIHSAKLTAIGGASNVTLGFYDVPTKTYEWKTFTEAYEVTSMLGNISQIDNQPFVHAHVTIADRNFQVYGGHLKEATVGGTLEMYIYPSDITISRVEDTDVGLKLLDLDH